MECYRQAVEVLPLPLRAFALEIEAGVMSRVEEVRLRQGYAPTLVLPSGERPVPKAAPVDGALLTGVVERASRWSVHSVLEQLRRGYLTVAGGHRLGLCGTVVIEEGQIRSVRGWSGLALRIARPIRGAALEVARQLPQGGALPNTLILAPPGAGKTTFLRDLIRCLSSGIVGEGMRVAVADERGELAGLCGGQACMDLGERTDVLDGCPKALAIPILLRGMAPQVIAVDEITEEEDLLVMEQAIGCGVSLLATAHGRGREDLERRLLYRKLMEREIFERLITIRVQDGERCVSMERLL